MNRSISALLAFLLALPFASPVWALAAGPGPAGAPNAAPSTAVVIPLEPYLGALWSFQGDLNGRKGRFLLDTAGGLTAVTPDGAQAAGCKPWGHLAGFRMRGDRVDLQRCDDIAVEVAGVRLQVPTAGLFDMSRLLPAGAPPLAGSVALDAFAGRTVTLDLAHRRLVIETPSSLTERLRTARAVPVRFSREVGGLALTPLVAVETPKGRAWMELDSGSDAAVIVDRRTAEPLGLNPETRTAQPLAAKIAGGVDLAGPALVEDLILDGNIGLPVLARWTLTLDLASERLWISPAAQPQPQPQPKPQP